MRFSPTLHWTVAALAGLGLSLSLIMLMVPRLVRGLAQTQAPLLAFAVVVIAYLCVAAGFALMGALSAKAFALRPLGVRPQTGPYRLSVSLGVAGGVLVIPTVILSALVVVSKDGTFAATLDQLEPLLFIGVTGLYGLLSGTLLGLLLLRVSQAWRVVLAAAVGSMLGGGLVTLLLRLLPLSLLVHSSAGIIPVLIGALVIIHLCWCGAVAAALGRTARLWESRDHKPNASARQVWAVATAGLLSFLAISSSTRVLADFVTSRPIDTSPLIPPQPVSSPGCTPPRDGLIRRAWDVYMRDTRPDLSCGNRVTELLRIPERSLAPAQATTFDHVGQLIRQARHEVLFTTMEYAGGEGNPGRTLSDALGALYAKVKADPASYPEGMQVALTLGNYPVVPAFEWGAQVWTLLDDLQASGVPLNDPAVGWQVRLGNYKGTYPHSHVKLIVIDGEQLITAGFNYSFTHYVPDPADERRKGLFDLALVTHGPAAQDGVAAFDDLWNRSKQVSCGPDPQDCSLTESTPLVHLPAVRQARRQTNDDSVRVLSLYRRTGETQANDALMALMNGAQTRLDLMHVNFSMNITCAVAVLNPSLCTSRDQMPYLSATLDALRRGVPVRLLTDPLVQPGSIENRIAVGYIRAVMQREGIPPERFQVRLFPTPVHAKATLTDDVLTVGSLNMHYSSWTQGPIGLNEAVAATNDPATVADFRQLYSQAWANAQEMPSPTQ